MNENNHQCPECGSTQFITEPNQYDVLEFYNEKFEIIRSESTEDEYKIFCEDCYEEVDVETSLKEKRVVLIKQ